LNRKLLPISTISAQAKRIDPIFRRGAGARQIKITAVVSA
jgi:hypothetical protein